MKIRKTRLTSLRRFIQYWIFEIGYSTVNIFYSLLSVYLPLKDRPYVPTKKYHH